VVFVDNYIDHYHNKMNHYDNIDFLNYLEKNFVCYFETKENIDIYIPDDGLSVFNRAEYFPLATEYR